MFRGCRHCWAVMNALQAWLQVCFFFKLCNVQIPCNMPQMVAPVASVLLHCLFYLPLAPSINLSLLSVSDNSLYCKHMMSWKLPACLAQWIMPLVLMCTILFKLSTIQAPGCSRGFLHVTPATVAHPPHAAASAAGSTGSSVVVLQGESGGSSGWSN